MSRALGVGLLAGAVAFCWWEGGLHQDQTAAHWSVLAVIGATLLAAVLAGAGRQPEPVGRWARGPFPLRRHLAEDRAGTLGAALWVLVVAAVVGWDLNSFVHQAHDLPTLSSIFGHVTSSRAGRAGLFALWLALGATLALGWRRSRGRA